MAHMISFCSKKELCIHEVKMFVNMNSLNFEEYCIERLTFLL